MWFYFRIGYSVYLSFMLGAVNTLVVVWYLAIRDIPAIEDIFGHFVPFAVFSVAVGVPFSVGIGWAHYKRTSAYSSEVDVQTEANPYNFKLIPGKEKEVWAPLYLEVLTLLRKLAESQNLVSSEELSRIRELENKIGVLLRGGIAGIPRKRVAL